MILNRIPLLEEAGEESIFLWGARQTGKSTLLKKLFPDASYYDLLKSDEYTRLSIRPSLLREECEMLDEGELVIIDEVQKIPALLDEVHWLMSVRNLRFILCGSSARKLRRCGANLLGGRAIRKVLFPLVSREIPDFDIERALNNGMLPRHYLVKDAQKRLEAYVGDYLQQEIVAEAVVRRIDSFTRFLQVAALSDAEIINYTNIASDCGVSAKSVKEYFSILEETMLGYMVPAYSKVVRRKLVAAPKFYFFDVGIPNYLLRRMPLRKGTAEYGHALEHLVCQELKAYLSYRGNAKPLSYWHTSDNRYEVDFIIGDAEVAVEVKSSSEVSSSDTKGLRAFSEEYPEARLIVVSMEARPRRHNGIEIWPVGDFLKRLWNDKFV
ncbi:DUF4143 domain-containing protein [Bacteroides sp.]|uniref:ATP-binding protein n=1 Tax=Bacteroides sp. TaxID=29523 RepID=UPI0023D710A2|nr:DUF4143 domain-containing protein [Bacteroides sp.]MDE5711308.1 AAA family ATPase [Bacteroides sp.]MDE6216309.1 AAA family ATPase [Bacteroides sp.]